MTAYSEFTLASDETNVILELLGQYPLSDRPLVGRESIELQRLNRQQDTLTGSKQALPRILLFRWATPGEGNTTQLREALIYDGKLISGG